MDVAFDEKIIFVGGIHGVGKTTLCREMSNKLSLNYYSSSELISNLKSENISKNEKVNNVIENQNILLESIDTYIKDEEPYLLDGHFCLLNCDEEVTEIPIDIF